MAITLVLLRFVGPVSQGALGVMFPYIFSKFMDLVYVITKHGLGSRKKIVSKREGYRQVLRHVYISRIYMILSKYLVEEFYW